MHSQIRNNDFGALVQLVRMPACHAGGHGFESRTHRKKQRQDNLHKRGVAQLVAFLVWDQAVAGSSPVAPTKPSIFAWFFCYQHVHSINNNKPQNATTAILCFTQQTQYNKGTRLSAYLIYNIYLV